MCFESWCGPQHSGREKDLRMQVWTSIHWQRERPANKKAHKDSAELRTNEEPIPSTSDFLFRGAFVTVPLRSFANKGLCQQRGGEDGTTRELQVEWKKITMAPERRRNTNSLSPNQQTRRMMRTFFTNARSQHDTPSKGSAPKFTLLRLAQSEPSPLPSYV